MNNIDKYLPVFYSGKELKAKLTRLPEYKASQRLLTAEQRLLLLDNLYEIYLPTKMSFEIYSKLYIALSRSLNKKLSIDAVRQRNENHRMIQNVRSNGLIGGADSILITGTAGIGKTSAISNAVSLLSGSIIDTEETKIIPVLMVQCPFDCSVKGMLVEIIKRVDSILDTDYSQFIYNRGMTTDVLIGIVSQVTLNHIGVLIIDEIQNVVKSRQGVNLVGALTQLINCSGTSIVMVGTPESRDFFEREEFFARRALGMFFDYIQYGEEFSELANTELKYNYTRRKASIDESIYVWIYEHTKGLPSNVTALIHDAQELAILRGSEEINIETLNQAFSERLTALHSYIDVKPVKVRNTRTKSNVAYKPHIYSSQEKDFSLISLCREHKNDIVSALQEYVEVVEV